VITFDFDYYRPDTIEEAINVYKKITGQEKKAIYYAGGTEIVSMSRVNQLSFDSVIDIKAIPECNVIETKDDKLIIGSAVCLTRICDFGGYPLLGAVCRRIAEHTARDMITLGGNILGKIQYKEAILPLLLTDSKVTVAGTAGKSEKPIDRIFNEKPLLNAGELLVNIIIDKKYINNPYSHSKKTKQEKIDYPLVTIASVKNDDEIRIGFSGLCVYPFRLDIIFGNIDNTNPESEINNILNRVPAPIVNDILGSAEYREFVTRNLLIDLFNYYGGMN